MTNLLLLLLSFIIFVGYLIYVYNTVGILKSVSDSYYKVKQPILFILTMMLFPIPMMIVGSTPLMFFSGAFICFVGAAPGITRLEMEERVHVIGATGGIILGTASIWIDLHLWYFAIANALFAIYCSSKFNKIKNHTWWVEIVAFLFMFTTLFIRRVL
jgi:hypothetical protein